MKPHLGFIAAGALCLPLTYSITREGSIMLSIAVVIALSGAAALVVGTLTRRRHSLQEITFTFSLGALFSELIAFGNYSRTYASQAHKISRSAERRGGKKGVSKCTTRRTR